jgi:hypothetical protein
MSGISGYTVFAVIAIIVGLWFNRQVRLATERELAEQARRKKTAHPEWQAGAYLRSHEEEQVSDTHRRAAAAPRGARTRADPDRLPASAPAVTLAARAAKPLQ